MVLLPNAPASITGSALSLSKQRVCRVLGRQGEEGERRADAKSAVHRVLEMIKERFAPSRVSTVPYPSLPRRAVVELTFC